jgi:hypothetical protein
MSDATVLQAQPDASPALNPVDLEEAVKKTALLTYGLRGMVDTIEGVGCDDEITPHEILTFYELALDVHQPLARCYYQRGPYRAEDAVPPAAAEGAN